MYGQQEIDLKPSEVLMYLRKSRSDDPLMTVEEVLEKHEQVLDEWAKKHLGGVVPEENKLREVGSGETISNRPEMQRLLKFIENPKYQAVLIVEVQRLSRGDLEDAGRIIKLFRYTNTLVLTPQIHYNLQDEYARDMFERELKRGNEYLEYTKKIMLRGRLGSVREGNFIGQKPPYGYDKIIIHEGKRKCHTLTPNETEASVVRMIFEMYVNEDMGRVSIAHRLNELGIKPRNGGLWSQDTIKRMLDNEHYIGKVRWNWRKTVSVVEDGEVIKTRPQSKVGEYLVFEGKHPAIISDELFKAAEAKRGRNHKAKANTKVRNPLAGLLYCQCGRAMSLRTYRKDGKERAPARLLCDNQRYCKTTSCLYDEIIERVIEVLQQCIADFEIRIENNAGDSVKHHQALVKNLEKQLQDLHAREIIQWEQQSDPDPAKRMPQEVFQHLNGELLKKKEEIRQALCKAKESAPAPVDYEEKVKRFSEALEALTDPSVSAQKKNRLLKACIDRIDYKREKAERIKSKQERYYDPVTKKTRYKSPLTTGGNWTKPPIELDIKLRV